MTLTEWIKARRKIAKDSKGEIRFAASKQDAFDSLETALKIIEIQAEALECIMSVDSDNPQAKGWVFADAAQCDIEKILRGKP